VWGVACERAVGLVVMVEVKEPGVAVCGDLCARQRENASR
jgi:hypothetical protein